MHVRKASHFVRRFLFRGFRSLSRFVGGGRIAAFGPGRDRIGSILVVNLDRQPQRWRRLLRELGRFRTAEGETLAAITRRLAAVDARDGRSAAAGMDVDPAYRLADQLFVQPDARLERIFGPDEPIRMSPQEVAIARSHIEVWKAVAEGADDHVLVLEDDVWFRAGAARAIERGWSEAIGRCRPGEGPHLVYLSYSDAEGTLDRADVGRALFRPVRGLWFLSGYVLSREGARRLLQARPVVGPVDLWINYLFDDLGALALSAPAILQRRDSASDNSYSIMPYLVRAGIVEAGALERPNDRPKVGHVLAWTRRGEREGLAMALSMLGLRVRAFDGAEPPMEAAQVLAELEIFDVLVDAPLAVGAAAALAARDTIRILREAGAALPAGLEDDRVPAARRATLEPGDRPANAWAAICDLLKLGEPEEPFPSGAPRAERLFRRDRMAGILPPGPASSRAGTQDDSPWILPSRIGWQAQAPSREAPVDVAPVAQASMREPSPLFRPVAETFPGNLASFARDALVHDGEGARLTLDRVEGEDRPYRSAAFASVGDHGYGRFEADIRAAPGAGLVTGFFLYRDDPRQEIDVEITGDDPTRLLVNVYFNPGDEGGGSGYGYRGSPCRVELGFDATQAFHRYAIDWRPGCITWLVDGAVVHQRLGWDPTPVPHLPMRLFANLWAPKSAELAGSIDERALPATTIVRDVAIRACVDPKKIERP